MKGRPISPGVDPETALYLASDGYLETLRIPLVEGRAFEDRELAEGAPVVVVSRSLAVHCFSTLYASLALEIALGLAGALPATRLAVGMLTSVGPNDPAVFL